MARAGPDQSGSKLPLLSAGRSWRRPDLPLPPDPVLPPCPPSLAPPAAQPWPACGRPLPYTGLSLGPFSTGHSLTLFPEARSWDPEPPKRSILGPLPTEAPFQDPLSGSRTPGGAGLSRSL